MANQTTVSFVLPALNEERHLEACLLSIRRLILPANVSELEVIVVDNHSTDRTVEIAKRYGATVLTVHPGSVSRARNAGARAAKGSWLAFIDADCELSPGWLATCGRHLEQEGVMAAGSAMVSPSPAATWVERCWHVITQARTPMEPTSVRWLPAFNILTPRANFNAIGGFDESLTTCEDCDFGFRLSTLGRLMFDPEPATIHHGESRTLGQLFRREAWRSHGNIRLACSRLLDWRNWLSLLLPIATVAGALASIALALLAARHSASYWPWSLLALGVAVLPFVALTARIRRQTNFAMMPRIWLVFAVYLAGRCAGLLFPAPRVSR
jgi:glycosyltransferase involved in cell wall biosynthesis